MDERLAHSTVAAAALAEVADGAVIGLGSGRAATAFIRALGERVRAGLRVRAVPTSEATAALARAEGIPLATLDEVAAIDVAIDGADEVDPRLDLIKGLGGALVREKIVAAAARRLIILVGPEKLVPMLGSRGTLPVEVVPFALGPVRRRIAELGFPATVRGPAGAPFITDNGNLILDCQVAAIPAPGELELALRAIPGVVGTGLFLGMAHRVLIQESGAVRVLTRPRGNLP